MIIRLKLIKQMAVFATVGLCALLVNLFVVIVLVEQAALTPLVANVFGFGVAFLVSFSGHHYVTFKIAHSNQTSWVQALWRFWWVALVSFLLTEALYAVLLHGFHWEYRVALVIVLLIVPTFTFISSKLWAFGGRQP